MKKKKKKLHSSEYNLNLKIENDIYYNFFIKKKISNADFHRYYGHHRLRYKSVVFTDSSNELVVVIMLILSTWGWCPLNVISS